MSDFLSKSVRQNAIGGFLKEAYFTRNESPCVQKKIGTELEAVVSFYDSNVDFLIKVVSLTLYYSGKNTKKPTRSNIIKAICDLFALHGGSLRTKVEVERLLGEERFVEYYKKSEEIVRKKFKHLFLEKPQVSNHKKATSEIINIKKPRYAVKHKPTGKFYTEDEAGGWLLDEKEAFITFGTLEEADQSLKDLPDEVYDENGVVSDPIPKNEFEVAEV
jgi:hypothetical protein